MAQVWPDWPDDSNWEHKWCHNYLLLTLYVNLHISWQSWSGWTWLMGWNLMLKIMKNPRQYLVCSNEKPQSQTWELEKESSMALSGDQSEGKMAATIRGQCVLHSTHSSHTSTAQLTVSPGDSQLISCSGSWCVLLTTGVDFWCLGWWCWQSYFLDLYLNTLTVIKVSEGHDVSRICLIIITSCKAVH